MSKRVVIPVVVLLAIVVAIGVRVVSYLQSPRYSLYLASKAIDKHDFDGFAHYVDYKKVISAAGTSENIKPPKATPQPPEGKKTTVQPNDDPIGNQIKAMVADGSLAREFRPTGIYDSLTRMSVIQHGSSATATLHGAGSDQLVLTLTKTGGRWMVTSIDLKRSKL